LSEVTLLDNTGETKETTGGVMAFGSGSFVPNEYALYQNYPNPFNPSTTIRYDLKEAGFVTIAIFNVLGQQVANLVNMEMPAGRHVVNFDATNLTSGLYIYTIQTNGFSDRKKMMLMR
jgi:hypothetical protein